ncbi:hypothetical protein V6N12_033116 [Hibiscus sabdariffa]|uniref:CASP-like protein n=1 Tax=Hibiscus sabdariffa TaxID=183260 RepID=A0ABR2BEM0_9ROSI
MEADKAVETSINIADTKSKSKGKAPLSISSKAVIEPPPKRGVKKGLAIGDFVLRLCAMGATTGAAVTVGNAQQTLPFFTQFFQFQAQFNDIPTLVFFIIACAIVTGYLVLSLPFSVICIIRPLATTPRLLLVIFDAVKSTHHDGWSNDSGRFSDGIDNLFGSQRELEHELASVLPTVRRFLPECEWGGGGVAHRRRSPPVYNHPFSFRPEKKLKMEHPSVLSQDRMDGRVGFYC